MQSTPPAESSDVDDVKKVHSYSKLVLPGQGDKIEPLQETSAHSKITDISRSESAQLDEIISNATAMKNIEDPKVTCGSHENDQPNDSKEDKHTDDERQERLKVLWDEHYMETYWHEFGLYCNQHGVDESGNVGQRETIQITEIEEEPVPDNALVIDWQDIKSGKVIMDDLMADAQNYKLQQEMVDDSTDSESDDETSSDAESLGCVQDTEDVADSEASGTLTAELVCEADGKLGEACDNLESSCCVNSGNDSHPEGERKVKAKSGKLSYCYENIQM